MPQTVSSPISADVEKATQQQSMTAISPPEAALPPISATKPAFTNSEEAANKCNQWVESGIAKNKSIQFLLKTLIDSGCTPPEHFIRCVQCEQPQAGGFGMVVEERLNTAASPAVSSAINAIASKEQCQRTAQELRDQITREQSGSTKLKIQPEIFVCQQYMDNEHMAHKTVHHELIHAVDMCRTKMDPLHNCVHLACTEIRAENLSGECSFFKELPRMASFRKHGQECVRRRAILSVKANPNCTARAEEYVDAALPRCFQDNYPYDRHPNQR
jgi:Peptidase M76 family